MRVSKILSGKRVGEGGARPPSYSPPSIIRGEEHTVEEAKEVAAEGPMVKAPFGKLSNEALFLNKKQRSTPSWRRDEFHQGGTMEIQEGLKSP